MAGTAAAANLAELAFAHISVPLFVLDPKRRIQLANPAACTLLRAQLSEIRGRDLTELIRSDDPTWCSTDPVDQLATPAAGRRMKVKIKNRRRIRKVGVKPLLAGETEVGALVSVRDAARDADRDPNEEKEHLVSLGELSACVAHEIRNPLTGIRTTVQFVSGKLGQEHPRYEDLVDVIKEMDRIEQIIGDLLLFARPAEGKRVLGSLNDHVTRVLDSMESQFESAEVEVVRNLSDKVTPFIFSPDGIQQVLLNLVRNALEAMPEGGRLKVTSTVRNFRSSRLPAAELFISDSGHGISEDLLQQIFKPFFTTRHNGTGLGLAISANIARGHGGSISARNRATGGATFRVSLPMITEVEDDK